MKNELIKDFLSQYSLFSNLNTLEFENVIQKVKRMSLGKNEMVYQIGDRADKIVFLMKGCTKLATTGNDGRELIKGILHPLALFGELAISGQQFREEYSVTMDEKNELCYLYVKDLQVLMNQSRQLSNNIISMLANRLLKSENKLESLMFKDARSRIIEFLKDSAKTQGKRVGLEILVRHSLTQQDIANITGTSRQTVTSVLNDLRKDNLI